MANSGHFAECLHSAKSKESLPSVITPALGKKVIFAECQASGTRQSNNLCRKVTIFAECLSVGTRQRVFLCRVPWTWHSANHPLCPYSVTALKFCRVRDFVLGKGFAECPMKCTRQSPLCRHFLFRVSFAKCNTRQNLCRVFLELCRVFLTLGKVAISRSGFSKYAHFIALGHPYSATSVARTFFDQIVWLHGIPCSIVSDHGPVFPSTFRTELFQLSNVELRAHHALPQVRGGRSDHPTCQRSTATATRAAEHGPVIRGYRTMITPAPCPATELADRTGATPNIVANPMTSARRHDVTGCNNPTRP
jgi:hypothetical protein